MDTVIVRPPDGAALGEVLSLRAPPAKSVALRALEAATLAGGGEIGLGGPRPDDVRVFLEGLRRLGVPLHDDGGAVIVTGPATPPAGPVRLDAADGGAPARFLLALAARLGGGPVTVDGSRRLRERPMAVLLAALRALGARVEGGPGLPATVTGPLRGGALRVPAASSSQFVSALLLVAPGLAPGLDLALEGDPVSAPYVALTRWVMGRFGAAVGTDLRVAGTARYRPARLRVEPDWSGAAVLLAAAPLLGRAVRVPGLDPASPQPDRRIAALLGEMGLRVREDTGAIRVGGALGREAALIDLTETPDLAPPLAVLGALAPGGLRLRGCAHLRIKESDRLETLGALIRAAGGRVRVRPDGLDLAGGLAPVGAAATPIRVAAEGDHRIVMAAALLGLIRPVAIEGASAVSKSFPGFFEQWPGSVVQLG